MKKIVSFLLVLIMSVAMISPAQIKEVQAAETVPVSTWVISDLMQGDTYGIYPSYWYEKGVTGTLDKGKFSQLYVRVRRKIAESGCVKEMRFAKPVVGNPITVEDTLKAFYTLLSNYDYPIDLGFGAGLDPVSYMKLAGVYTGQNGEQGLQDACSVEQAMVIGTRIITLLYEAVGASSKGFFWEVKSGENTVYLLGSIHLASTDIYPMSSDIWKAYYNSKALVVEANLYDQADTLTFSQLMYYSDGTTLKDHVTADTYQKCVAAAALIGLSEETILYLKPWALYLTFADYSILGTPSGSDVTAQLGIDMNFLTNAAVWQKPVYAIEGLTGQGSMLDSFSDGLQDYLLSETSSAFSNMANGTAAGDTAAMNEYVELMYESWKTGDTESFAALSAEDGEDTFASDTSDQVKAYEKEYTEKFMTQRDDKMAAYIDNLLKSEGSNSYFVIVGAAHYISDYSVIDRLEKEGYEVKQIK